MTDRALTPEAAEQEAEHARRALDEKAFGFWIYLMSDAIIFALLFATYAVMRPNTAGGPSGHDLFDLPHTLIETMLLLTSSMTFGFSSVATDAGRRTQTVLWLGVTFALGAGFVGMEISEFHGMVAMAAGPDRSGFLSAFFTLVGTHGLHVSIGLVWIILLGLEVSVRGLSPRVRSQLNRLGMFWHFLDIVWIGIFSVVYLPGIL
ncbi:MAG TPA: cytochrome o ubiquinol oxidase subunit III [Alphaproteobacteria bacterium]|nr:cytochrome o ubiquinol oxidase subunit III [Alphaproteobacteria bacterium]